MATATLALPETAATRSAGDTDHHLISRVRQGDDRAFAVLYERYHRRIAAYIYGMVKDYGRAEDIAQDVFMSALRRMRETDRDIAFKPWIYEIAKNACIDQFRRSRRAEEVSYDADEGLGAADYGRLVTTGPTPDVAVEQKMSLDHLRGAFNGLSETHHEILVMREFEGLSYREIGDRLGMSRPSVESTLFRARRRLAEEYEELVSGERCLRVQAIISGASGGSLGTRDKRRMSAHVSHCQPCRRHAHAAGIDAQLLEHARPVRAKIAAIIPLPAFLRRRWGGEEAAAPQHSATVAQWTTQLSTFGDPAVASWAKAVAAAATLAIAGLGVDAATQRAVSGGGSSSAKPALGAPVTPATSTTRTSGTGTRSGAAATPRRASSGTSTPASSGSRGATKTSSSAPAATGAAGSSAPSAPTSGSGVATPIDNAPVAGELKKAAPTGSPDAPTGRKPSEYKDKLVNTATGDGERIAGTPVEPVKDAVDAATADTVSQVDTIVHGG